MTSCHLQAGCAAVTELPWELWRSFGPAGLAVLGSSPVDELGLVSSSLPRPCVLGAAAALLISSNDKPVCAMKACLVGQPGSQIQGTISLGAGLSSLASWPVGDLLLLMNCMVHSSWLSIPSLPLGCQIPMNLQG